MKHALWFVTALALFAIPMTAAAQFPRPRPPAPSPVVTDPAPPSIPAPPVVNVPAPQVTVTPTLALPDPTATQSFLQWLNVALGTLIMGFLGKIAFKPAAAGAGGGLSLPAGVSDLAAKLQDPAVRAAIDGLALQAVRSGIPGTLIQSGASLIPGVGPAAAGLEPLLRQAVIDILQRQHGTVALPPATIDASANPPPPPPPAQVDILGSLIANLTKTIESRFPPHA